MEAQTITVRVEQSYGQQRVYPVCERAKLFCEIAGTSTLTKRNIKAIKALGFTIEVQLDQVRL